MYDLEFTPKKDEELISLLKEGEGQFTVIKATKKTSKNGNPMIELILKCWDREGNEGNIFDYIIINETIFSMRKIKHFCYAAGIEEKYESGKLNAYDCENRSGNLVIGIQSDKEGKYPDKNCVSDYLKKKEENNSSNEKLDDDIPF